MSTSSIIPPPQIHSTPPNATTGLETDGVCISGTLRSCKAVCAIADLPRRYGAQEAHSTLPLRPVALVPFFNSRHYLIEDASLTVMIVKIGHRREVYRN